MANHNMVPMEDMGAIHQRQKRGKRNRGQPVLGVIRADVYLIQKTAIRSH